MIEQAASAGSLLSLGKYLLQWLNSLSRASAERKAECINALDRTIAATRETMRYCRERDRGKESSTTEARLATMWTTLGFEFENVGIPKLAKRCDIKGRYWAAPDKFSDEWLDQADITLESVERLARQLKTEVRLRGVPK
jgi:hypothetical protein